MFPSTGQRTKPSISAWFRKSALSLNAAVHHLALIQIESSRECVPSLIRVAELPVHRYYVCMHLKNQARWMKYRRYGSEFFKIEETDKWKKSLCILPL